MEAGLSVGEWGRPAAEKRGVCFGWESKTDGEKPRTQRSLDSAEYFSVFSKGLLGFFSHMCFPSKPALRQVLCGHSLGHSSVDPIHSLDLQEDQE